MLLVGDDFILQVMGVFTRIRSGLHRQQTTAARTDLLRCSGGGGGSGEERHKCRCVLTKATAGSENPKGLSVYL
jgi:hypothetical protein